MEQIARDARPGKKLPQPPGCGILVVMSVSRLNENEMRPGEYLLAWAFVISLSTHLLLFACFELGQRMGWWHRNLLPVWLRPTQQVIAEIQKAQKLSPPVQRDIPLEFVEVDPAQATPEPPKNAPFYSSHNSLAANPDPQIETGKPKIDGTQTHIPKTETTDRSKAFPLQPSAPKTPEPKNEETAQSRPKGGQKPGDLAMAKPMTRLQTNRSANPRPASCRMRWGKRPSLFISVHAPWRRRRRNEAPWRGRR